MAKREHKEKGPETRREGSTNRKGHDEKGLRREHKEQRIRRAENTKRRETREKGI